MDAAMTTLFRYGARFAAFLPAALLVGLQLAEGSGFHRCPAHDGALPHNSTGHHTGSSAGGSHEHGGSPGGCTCLGTCHATSPTAVPAAGHWAVAPTLTDRSIALPGILDFVIFRDHSHPF